MKNKKYIALILMLICQMGNMAFGETTFDFTSISSADETLLKSDNTGNWIYDSSKRYCYVKSLTNEPLIASNKELDFAKGLLFTCTDNETGQIRLGAGRLYVGGSGNPITIPNLMKGQTIKVRYKSSNTSSPRTFTLSDNATAVAGFTESTSEQIGEAKVNANGDVVLKPTGGLYVYALEISDVSTDKVVVIPGATASLYEDVVTNNVNRNSKSNQMYVETLDGRINYYDTSSLNSVDMDKEESTVVVTTKSGNTDTYYGSVKNISFSKGISQGENADITNNGVVITESKGWLESAYVKWELYEGATNYAVYIKGGNIGSYTKLDNMLVRDYGTYGRADMVGLVAGNDYSFKVVPVVSDAEVESAASYAENIKVANYVREGFAHLNHSGVGAYKNDGSLKEGAKVFYVTKNTIKTITSSVVVDGKGKTETFKGLQHIIDAYQKGYDTTPMSFRLLGKISVNDLDSIGSKEEGLQVKGNKKDSEMNITIEGIGEDATIYGFGILIRNCKDVELRNFGIMQCMDDGISLDTDNSNIWVHHIDVFYGKNKGGDQVKGDGAIDVKSDSKYVTIDNCHFWDTGKSSMSGMKSESGPNYITYHHNWYDHSDSRHPRIRTMSVHVWNNYFDGVSKYGVGATTGSSAFVENNYFRNTKYPMLISLQGHDGGTFSGEDGGMIKSFNNVFAEKCNYTTYQQNAGSFDAWEATSREDIVPSSVKAIVGGSTYDNFDTNASLMYTYTPDAPADVPSKVEGWHGAGRMGHGDFQWVFTSEDDTDYEINTDLETAIKDYKSLLQGIFGGETISGGGGDTPGGEEPGDDPSGTTITADVECTFTGDGPSNTLFTVENGNYSNTKGTATVNNVELTWCLKLESTTIVSFTTEEDMTLTLVFGSNDTKYTIKVDDIKMTGKADNGSSGQGTLTMTLPKGAHTLKKADTGNLFYIGLAK